MSPTLKAEAVSPQRVAILLSVSESTVLRLIRSRKLKAFRVGRQWRIDVAAVSEALTEAKARELQAWQDANAVIDPPSGAVYFVSSNGLIKIGITTQVTTRIKALAGQSPQPLVLLGSIDCQSISEARSLESAFHTQFASARRHGEWFDLPIETVRAVLADRKMGGT